jgi:hypothetical protein
MSEREPTETERLEAAALAETLESGRASEGAPRDALSAATFLQQGGAPLTDLREAAVWAAIAPSVRSMRRRGLGRRGWTAVLALGAAAAVAAVLLGPLAPRRAASPRLALRIPLPTQSLLDAQARAVRDRDSTALVVEMRRYREQVYGALALQYRSRR